MRHRVQKIRLNRKKGPRELLIRSLATSVILYESVKTTKAKAKLAAPLVERMITAVKTKDAMNAIRYVNQYLLDKNASKKLTQEIAEKYKNQQSGFTRISDLGPRSGDNAPMVQLELV